MPNSARFKYPKILDKVPDKPMNSGPKQSRKTFREKKDRIIAMK